MADSFPETPIEFLKGVGPERAGVLQPSATLSLTTYTQQESVKS